MLGHSAKNGDLAQDIKWQRCAGTHRRAPPQEDSASLDWQSESDSTKRIGTRARGYPRSGRTPRSAAWGGRLVAGSSHWPRSASVISDEMAAFRKSNRNRGWFITTHQRHSRFRIDRRKAVAFAPTCKGPRGGPSLVEPVSLAAE